MQNASFREAGLAVNTTVSFPYPGVIEKSLLEIYEEVSAADGGDRVVVRNLFENLVRRIARAGRGREDGKRIPDRFGNIKLFIETNHHRQTTLSDLAAMAHLSIPHFCSEFKKYYGVSAVSYLISVRMHNAIHHLGNTNHSVSEIAGMVGYDDIYHFSKMFKKRYGLSPRAMRRRILG